MNYNCEVCGYGTNRNRDYLRHLKSKKHNKNIKNYESTVPGSGHACGHCGKIYDLRNSLKKHEKKCKSRKKMLEENVKLKKKFICEFCGIFFDRKYNQERHTNACYKKKINDYEVKLKEKDDKLREKDNRLEEKDQMINFYKEVAQANKPTEAHIKNDISDFTFINAHYKKARPLRGLTYKKFVKRNKIQYIENNASYNDRLVWDILYCSDNGILDEYIGDVIKEIYKNNQNPDKQSVWSTDSARLKFVIKLKDLETGIERWAFDEKGKMTGEKIIKPVLKKIEDLLEDFIKFDCDIRKGRTMKEKEEMVDNAIKCNEIIKKINTGTLTKDVLRYISPFFKVQKEIPLEVNNSDIQNAKNIRE